MKGYRPDGEGADQPTFAEIDTACHEAGLRAAYITVMSGKVDDPEAQTFGTTLDSMQKPTFAFCRTGTRSTTLWALSEAARARALPDI